jgi:hypothetical protein
MKGLLMLNLGEDLFGVKIFSAWWKSTEVFLNVKLEMVPQFCFGKIFGMMM